VRTIIPNNAKLVPAEATCVFEGKIFSVWQWQQEMYDGSFETFEMLKRPDIVTVVAVKGDRIIIVDQEQPTMKPFMDLPGGRHDIQNETELEAAKRELLEETGMSFKTWKLIEVRQFLPKIENFLYLFLATDFESQVEQNLDAGEKITVREVSFDEFGKLIASPKFRTKPQLLNSIQSIDELLNLPEYSDIAIQ
jgi:ADP-ribose pyrophosphatase